MGWWGMVAAIGVWTCGVATAAGCIAREHPLQQGEYQLAVESNLEDGCGLSGGGLFAWTGRYSVNGDYVRLTYDPLEITLVGAYGEVSDDFDLAGTRGPLNLTLPGGACDVDLAQVILDGQTDSENAFHGTLQVRYEKRNSDACSCETRSTYRASR